MLSDYLAAISTLLSRGDAREESYYSSLERLLLEFSAFRKKNAQVTILPKKTEAGNPDFRIWDGTLHVTGYIEAKDPSVTNLDQVAESIQLSRYRKTFPNVLLTNFFEFRLYRNGDELDRVSIGRAFIAKKLRNIPPVENEEKFYQLLEKFFSFSLPKIKTARDLALELAKRTRFLRDEVVSIELSSPHNFPETEQAHSPLHGFYEAFKKYLIATLSEEQFADLYAQTLTYGLFAARTRSNGNFSRQLAIQFIPQTIGILRDVFQFISLGKAPQSLRVIIDDIAEVLNATDVKKILHEYFSEGKGQDPIVHFYETFLAAYDPAVRERRGVYYTPEPIVRYIVRSIHSLLKSHFNLLDGLANPEVTLLDPAGGTLTFPAEAVKMAVEEYKNKYGSGGVSQLISNQILKNFYAFELMMAPYAIGHLKMSFLFEELGYQLSEDERFKLYLTNALEMEDLQQIQIPGLSSLSEESHHAAKVKKEEKILVVMGNPPYSIEAGTLTKEARQLVERYKFVDGVRIKEKGALQFEKNLQDDYVKFIAFAQQKIEHAGHGIIAMITNHSFLDNPTMRGMRNSLLNTFDEIYVIDLHGSGKKKEKTPEGGKDENVFDIQQGVSISFFIKLSEKRKTKRVLRADLFGLREEKYDWLETHTLENSGMVSLAPQAPTFFFKEFDYQAGDVYNSYFAVNEIFPVNGAGIITAHDNFVINEDAKALENRFVRFKNSKRDEDLLHSLFQVKKKKGWSITEAWDAFQKYSGAEIRDKIQNILYRPFDVRKIMYDDKVIWSSSFPTMRNMRKDNIGLLIGRQGQVVGIDHDWNLASITNVAIDFNYFYRGGVLLHPLYCYVSEREKPKPGTTFMLFEPKEKYEIRRPNISRKIYDYLVELYGKKPSPESIFYYICAILYSNTYRKKYAEFLKIDFPRIPFIKNYKLFLEFAVLGERLADLHLLQGHELKDSISKFEGERKMEKVVYNEKENRVYINSNSYFTGIGMEVWNYHIGGYQVLHKFLKDRKGTSITDTRHYCKIATAIQRTIEIQSEIDTLYSKHENDF